MDRSDGAASRFGSLAARLALALAFVLPSGAIAQSTTGNAANGAVLYAASCSVGCHGAAPLAVFASTANAANAGGHIEWTRLNGMPSPPLTAAQFNDIAAFIAQSVPDPNPSAVPVPFNSAAPLAPSAGIAIPNIFLGTFYGQFSPNLQFLSAGKGTASFTGTTATYTANACQTGSDTVSFQATRAGGSSNTRTFTVTIANPPAPVITSAASASATTGAPFGYGVTVATCASLVTSYSLSGNPAWLAINPSTGVVSGTPPLAAAGTTVNFTVGATYVGGASGTLAVSLAVALGVPSVTSAATAPAGAVGSPYPGYQITATNGPTSFAATGLPPGLVLDAASGLVSGTPTTGGTFVASVTASNAAGTGAPLGVTFNIVLNVPAVTSASTASGQTGAAFSYQITATNGPPFTGFSAAPLPPGLVLDAATGLISGTPAAAGATVATVTASNAAGPSAPFTLTITITVGPPVITSPPSASAVLNAPFTYQITATNSPTSFNATGLPPGLSVNTATGLVSGSPTASGTFAVTLSATNAVPLTGTRSLTITVASLDPVVTSPASATGETGKPFSFQVTAANNPTGFSATGLPPGLAIDAATGLVSGTPTAGGTFAVTITATNATGSASQVLTITIAFVAPVVRDLAIDVAFQTTTAIALPVTGLYTQVTILTQPEHGTLTGPSPGTATVTYQPAVGYSGADGFTWSATGPGGTSPPATVAITIPAFRPVVSAVSMTVQLNTPATLDLRPFITGSLVTGVFVPTAPSHGDATVNGTSVTYTPKRDFFGTDSFTYTAFGNAGSSAPGVVTVTVVGRPDPTRDAEVTGLLEAQARSSRRFSQAQISNYQRRMESLHAGPEPPTPPVAGAASPGAAGPATGVATPSAGASGRRDAPEKNPGRVSTSLLNALVSAAASNVVDLSASAGGDGESAGPGAASAWMGGTARFGKRRANEDAAALRFSSDGITVGADRRVSERLALGAGLGFARDRSDIGANGTVSEATGVSIAGYGSFQPTRSVFLDALLGYGSVDFESERFVASIQEFATGRRKGRQFFASAAGGYEFRHEGLLVSPYARVDVSVDRLREATESGAGLNALTYHEQTLRTTQVSAGLRLQSRHETSYGWVVPRARLEFRHDFEGGEAASLSWADRYQGLTYSVNPKGTTRNFLLLGVGADFLLRHGLRIGVDYQGERAYGPGTAQSLRLLVSKDLDGRGWPAWSPDWKPFEDPVTVEAGLSFDDNVGRGRLAAERYSDQVYTVGVNASRTIPIGKNTQAIATALLGVDKFREFTGLGRTSGGLQGELQYRASGDFDSATYGLFARGAIDAYESHLRSGRRLSAGVNARRSFTDRIDAFGEVAANWRRAHSAVFEGRDVAAKVNLDYSLGTAGTAYLAGEYRRGDTFSSGFGSLGNINSAEVLVRDDAFGPAEVFAYRAEARTLLGTIGYNRPLGPRDSIDFSFRRIQATPLSRPANSGPSSYAVNQYSILYLMRF